MVSVYPSIRYPFIRYPSIRYPSIQYPSIRYPSIRYPSIRYPSIRYPSIRYPSIRYPSIRYPVSVYPVSVYPVSVYPVSGTRLFYHADLRDVLNSLHSSKFSEHPTYFPPIKSKLLLSIKVSCANRIKFVVKDTTLPPVLMF